MQQERRDQRRALRAKRRALSPREQLAAARHLVRRIAATRAFRASRRIACYLPADGEIDPRPLIERIWRMRKVCYLPVLHRWQNRLFFAPYGPDTPLVRNRFGIPEPDGRKRRLLRAQELDLILMPLVGFDRRGNRLGMGGGFYDRSLGFLRYRRHWGRPRLFGLAHDFQRLERLDPQPWDIPMAGVVTDRFFYAVAAARDSE